MSEPAAESPASRSPGALGHFLLGGLLGGILGTALAALVFYLCALGFLYVEHTVVGAEQERITLPELADVVLMPPIAPRDLAPPPGKQDTAVDVAYLGECFQLLWSAVESAEVGPTLFAWAAAAALFGMGVGLVSAMVRRVLAPASHAWLGGLALLAALACPSLIHANLHLDVPLPWKIDAQGRLLMYLAVAGVNLLWISLAGSRFRALLFMLGAVLVSEIVVLGLPPERVTTTILWHSCLFLFVPSAYGWFVVERGESKGLIG